MRKKVKSDSSRPSCLDRLRDREIEDVTGLCALSARGERPADEIGPIVSAYVVSFLSRLPHSSPTPSASFRLPPWRYVPEHFKVLLFSLAADVIGVTDALTFDLSDQQAEDWMAQYGSLAEGFRRVVLDQTRRPFNGKMTYLFYVEPKKSKGKDARRYRDEPGRPRRFDVHCAIRIPDDPEIMSRFQKSVWKRTHKWTPVDPTDGFPLYKRGRFAYIKPITGEGWLAYCRKAYRLTKQLHRDKVGRQPYGMSNDVIREAKRIYEDVRRAVDSFPADPEHVAGINAYLDWSKAAGLRVAHARFTAACVLFDRKRSDGTYMPACAEPGFVAPLRGVDGSAAVAPFAPRSIAGIWPGYSAPGRPYGPTAWSSAGVVAAAPHRASAPAKTALAAIRAGLEPLPPDAAKWVPGLEDVLRHVHPGARPSEIRDHAILIATWASRATRRRHDAAADCRAAGAALSVF